MWEFFSIRYLFETSIIGKICKTSEKCCVLYEFMLSENIFSLFISLGKSAYFVLNKIYKKKRGHRNSFSMYVAVLMCKVM